LVQIIKNEQKLLRRFARRGYNEEELKKILGDKSHVANVTILKNRNFGENSLRDFVGTNFC
jgi:hypothetical protein